MSKKVIIITVFLFCYFFLFVNTVNCVNNPELQDTPPFFERLGWGNKNHIGPVPVISGTQRRLFYFLQPDLFIFLFFSIILVIATKHNFPCSFPHKADQPLAERAQDSQGANAP
ncbi:MAG: hypothetical protein AB1349_13250 [Elusimicrobiota bacterium]